MPTSRIDRSLDEREKIIIGKLSNQELINGITYNKFYDKYIVKEMSKGAYNKRIKRLAKIGLIERIPDKNRIILKSTVLEQNAINKKFEAVFKAKIQSLSKELELCKTEDDKKYFVTETIQKYYEEIFNFSQLIFMSIANNPGNIRSMWLFDKYVKNFKNFSSEVSNILKKKIGKVKIEQYHNESREEIVKEIDAIVLKHIKSKS